jgi:hypothetical protein
VTGLDSTIIQVRYKGKHNRSVKVAVQGLVLWPTPYTYIQVRFTAVGPLSVTANLGYDDFFLASYNNWKYKLTFRDFREAIIVITSVVDSIFVLWTRQVDSPGHSPLNPALLLLSLTTICRRAIAQAASRRLLTAAARVRAQVMWDLWWKKWQWGRFSLSTSVSPANSNSTDCSTFIIIYHPGLVQ